MRRMVTLFLLALAATGCCGYKNPLRQCSFKSLYHKPNEDVLEEFDYAGITDVVFGWGVQVRKETGIRLQNSCVVFDGKIKTIRMEFVTQDIVELQGARKTIVYIVEGLLNRVNNFMSVYGDLKNRPFGPENLQIIVTYESFENIFVDPKYSGRITMINGECIFSNAAIYDSTLDAFGCKHEPYFLVKQLVEIEKRDKTPYSSGYGSTGYNSRVNCPESVFKELYVPPPCIYTPPPY